ncbi:MAG: septum formation initiator family protein [Lachnospiraceae bacterium]|nr:septum formation initiator family protein [Lachnospiraceae bacterium]
MAGKRRRRSGSGKFIISVVVVILCIVLLVQAFRVRARIRENELRIAELKQLIAEQVEISEELDEEAARMKTLDYIERLAREKLGMLREDEIEFKKDN